MPTQEVNYSMAQAVTSANCAQTINTARRDRSGESREHSCLISLLFWALIAACNLEHLSKFIVFRATTCTWIVLSIFKSSWTLPNFLSSGAFDTDNQDWLCFSTKAKVMPQNLLPFSRTGAQPCMSAQCMAVRHTLGWAGHIQVPRGTRPSTRLLMQPASEAPGALQ